MNRRAFIASLAAVAAAPFVPAPEIDDWYRPVILFEGIPDNPLAFGEDEFQARYLAPAMKQLWDDLDRSMLETIER